LNQDARAIAHQGIGTDRATVIQILQNLQRLTDDFVGFVTFDVGHKTHTARIVLLVGLVQTLGKCLLHGAHPSFFQSRALSIVHCSSHFNEINWGQIPINS
jgi:hypothetical protein